MNRFVTNLSTLALLMAFPSAEILAQAEFVIDLTNRLRLDGFQFEEGNIELERKIIPCGIHEPGEMVEISFEPVRGRMNIPGEIRRKISEALSIDSNSLEIEHIEDAVLQDLEDPESLIRRNRYVQTTYSRTVIPSRCFTKKIIYEARMFRTNIDVYENELLSLSFDHQHVDEFGWSTYIDEEYNEEWEHDQECSAYCSFDTSNLRAVTDKNGEPSMARVYCGNKDIAVPLYWEDGRKVVLTEPFQELADCQAEYHKE